ncbi:MAG: glycosyltransferase family 4 protein [Halanaerobiaceae bacterium]
MILVIRLTYVLNIFGAGAVPNILLDLIPELEGYDINIVSLQDIDKENDYMVKKCHDKGIKLETLKLKRKQLIKSYFYLKDYFQRNKPDIIHSHLGRSDILSALCKPDDSKLITTFHNVRKNYNNIIKLMYWFTDNMVNCRLSVSKAVKYSWYDQWYLNSDNVVIYNPVNSDRIENSGSVDLLKKEFNINPNDKVILTIGRLIEQKGHIYLIEAMNKICQYKSNVKLIIAGEGKLDQYLEDEIKKRSLEDNIFLVGFRSDIPELLYLTDLFVFPSLWEGLGLAVLEAMLSRVPVIASDIPALREYIENGKNGYLVDYNDVDKMAERIIELLEDRQLRTEFAESGYKLVKELFAVDKIAKQYDALYKEVLKK